MRLGGSKPGRESVRIMVVCVALILVPVMGANAQGSTCDALQEVVRGAERGFEGWQAGMIPTDQVPTPPEGSPPPVAAGIVEDAEGARTFVFLVPVHESASIQDVQGVWIDAVSDCFDGRYWTPEDHRSVDPGKEKGVFFEEAYIREDRPPAGFSIVNRISGIRVDIVTDPGALATPRSESDENSDTKQPRLAAEIIVRPPDGE